MPEICRFRGIIIRIQFRDHNPPHFHAIYGGTEALVDIHDPIVRGRVPKRVGRMIRLWALLHKEELLIAWERARNAESPGKIAPLP